MHHDLKHFTAKRDPDRLVGWILGALGAAVLLIEAALRLTGGI